jgi:hypothetical protein
VDKQDILVYVSPYSENSDFFQVDAAIGVNNIMALSTSKPRTNLECGGSMKTVPVYVMLG